MKRLLGATIVPVTLAVCAAALATTTPPKVVGNVKVGKSLFKAHECGSCHNLGAAGVYDSSGAGPDLDHTKKTYTQIVNQITKGGNGMTPYKAVLTTAQIQDLAAFLYTNAHTSQP